MSPIGGDYLRRSTQWPVSLEMPHTPIPCVIFELPVLALYFEVYGSRDRNRNGRTSILASSLYTLVAPSTATSASRAAWVFLQRRCTTLLPCLIARWPLLHRPAIGNGCKFHIQNRSSTRNTRVVRRNRCSVPMRLLSIALTHCISKDGFASALGIVSMC